MPTIPAIGAITGTVAYVWQVERAAGTGVFEDIIADVRGDLAFQSANGTTFRVTAGSRRTGAARQGRLSWTPMACRRHVFSAPTAAVIDVADAPLHAGGSCA